MDPGVEPSRRFDALDSIRGLAALSVVFYHSLCSLPGFLNTHFDVASEPFKAIVNLLSETPLGVAWAGQSAVIVFFVLSGFVLALPHFSCTAPSYGPFVVRRIFRLYLPYAAAVFMALALRGVVAQFPAEGASDWWVNGVWSKAITSRTVVDHILMLGQAGENRIDPVVWSLVPELRVSLAFPLLVMIIRRWGLFAPAITTAAVYTVLRIGEKRLGIDQDSLTFSLLETLGYVPLFMLGITLAAHRTAIVALMSRAPAPLIATAGVLLVWLEPGIEKPHLRDLIAGPGAALLIVAALTSGGGFLNRPPMLWLGRISFSLYLIHLPVLLTIDHLLGDRFGMGWCAALAPAVSVLLGWVFYKAVERPAMRLGRDVSRWVAQPTELRRAGRARS